MSKKTDLDLLNACKEGHFTQAKELLQQGCNHDVREDDTQATLLHYACQHGSLSFVKTLVETYKCNVEARDKTNQTPLHYAAQNGYKDVLEYLIENQNCNPEPIDDNGDSPLHKACREGHCDLVSVLSKKCSRQLKNKQGYTPVQLATNREITMLFRQHSEKIFADAARARQSPSRAADTATTSSGNDWQVSGVSHENTQQGRNYTPSGAESGTESMSAQRFDSGLGSQSSESNNQYLSAAMGGADIDAESLRLIQQLTSQFSDMQLPESKASNEGASLLQLSEPPEDLELLVARIKSGVNEMSEDEYRLLKTAVANALSTSPNALYLVQLIRLQERSNSVELVQWGISSSLMNHPIHISSTNEENLKQHNVADIVYKGKCVFFNPTYYFEDGSGAIGSGGSIGRGSFRVKYISSDSDFESEMRMAGDKPTVVEFTADWCPPSLYIAPHFAKLSLDYPELLFLSVDADICRKSVSEYGVRAYPNFHFVKDGYSYNELNLVGYDVEELYRRVETWSKEHTNYTKPPDDLEIIVARIKVEDSKESGGYENTRKAIANALKTTSNSLYLIRPGIIPMKEGSSNINLVHWGISRSIMDHAHLSPEEEDSLKKHNIADIVYQGKCFFFNPTYYFGKSLIADVGSFGVKYITSDEDFKKALHDAGDGPVIVEFTAHWCPPSLYIAPYFLKLSVEFPEILFLSVDIDRCDYSSVEYGVDAVPAFHFMKGGHSFGDLSFSGYSIEKLTDGVIKWSETHASYVVPTKIKRTVTLWENGFTIDNGPLRTGDTYADELFLKSIFSGKIPQELEDAAYYGAVIDLDLQDKSDESYVKSKAKPFTGEGFKLGGPACAKVDLSKKTLSPSVGLPAPTLTPDPVPGVQSTRIRIRLAGGQVLCTSFKVTQTIQDIRDYIDRTSYGLDPDMSYILMTTTPRRQYIDPTQTLADADLCNAVITQKLVPKSQMPSLLASGWTTDGRNVKTGTHELETSKQSMDVPPECDNLEALKTVSICKQKLKRDFFSNPYALPVVSQYYYSTERVAPIPFVGPVAVVTCDHHGCQFKNEEHDIIITIPEGAIPEGLTVHFELAVAIIGPFNFARSDRRPISPILWMCPQESFEFRKPFTITLPHFLTEVKPEDLENVVFSKATEYCFYTTPDGERLYDFKTPPNASKPQFFSEDGVNYGSFQTSHCCLYCLENKKWKQDEMLKAGYFLHVVNAPQAVFFCVTFLLSSCLKAIKKQFPKSKDFRIRNPIIIQLMDDADIGPHIQIKLDERFANGIITQIPEDGIIKASAVDFWGYSEDVLEQYQKANYYPPRIELRLNEFTPQLCIKGCLEKEKDVLHNINPHLKFSIASSMPSLDPRQTGWKPNCLALHSQPSHGDSENNSDDDEEDDDLDIRTTLLTIDDETLDADDDWDEVVET